VLRTRVDGPIQRFFLRLSQKSGTVAFLICVSLPLTLIRHAGQE